MAELKQDLGADGTSCIDQTTSRTQKQLPALGSEGISDTAAATATAVASPHDELQTAFDALKLDTDPSASTQPGTNEGSFSQADTIEAGSPPAPAQLNQASLTAQILDAPAATAAGTTIAEKSSDQESSLTSSTAAQAGSPGGRSSSVLPPVQPVGGFAAGEAAVEQPAADQQEQTTAPEDIIAAPTSTAGSTFAADVHNAVAAVEPETLAPEAQAATAPGSAAVAASSSAQPQPQPLPPARQQPQTPQQRPAAAHIGLMLPAEAVTAVATPSAPEAATHIQVKLTRDEAATLAEQLAAVSLQPATPPVKQIQKDERVGLVYDVSMQDHVGPDSHWERPARTADLFQHITDTGLAARCWTMPARQASDAQLLRAHTREHIASVDTAFETHADTPPVGDMYYSSGTAAAARMAAGCTIEAAERVAAGDVERAFAVVRPPGHHAECACAMGFCFYNNAALAALAALERGVNRVLLFDWDVHHGNGTHNILESDPRVLYVSLHRGNGFYPGTGLPTDVGKDKGEGFSVNVAWQRGGAGDADYLAAWQLVVGPIIAAFAPDLVIISAGFDAAEGDPLGGCRLTPHGYGRLTELLLQEAGGRCVMALEGGYNTRVTSEAAAACLEVLLGGKAPPPDPFAAARPLKDTPTALAATAAAHAPYWPVLSSLASKEEFTAKWQDYLAAIPTPKSQRKTRGNSKFVDFVMVT